MSGKGLMKLFAVPTKAKELLFAKERSQEFLKKVGERHLSHGEVVCLALVALERDVDEVIAACCDLETLRRYLATVPELVGIASTLVDCSFEKEKINDLLASCPSIVLVDLALNYPKRVVAVTPLNGMRVLRSAEGVECIRHPTDARSMLVNVCGVFRSIYFSGDEAVYTQICECLLEAGPKTGVVYNIDSYDTRAMRFAVQLPTLYQFTTTNGKLVGRERLCPVTCPPGCSTAVWEKVDKARRYASKISAAIGLKYIPRGVVVSDLRSTIYTLVCMLSPDDMSGENDGFVDYQRLVDETSYTVTNTATVNTGLLAVEAVKRDDKVFCAGITSTLAESGSWRIGKETERERVHHLLQPGMMVVDSEVQRDAAYALATMRSLSTGKEETMIYSGWIAKVVRDVAKNVGDFPHVKKTKQLKSITWLDGHWTGGTVSVTDDLPALRSDESCMALYTNFIHLSKVNPYWKTACDLVTAYCSNSGVGKCGCSHDCVPKRTLVLEIPVISSLDLKKVITCVRQHGYSCTWVSTPNAVSGNSYFVVSNAHEWAEKDVWLERAKSLERSQYYNLMYNMVLLTGIVPQRADVGDSYYRAVFDCFVTCNGTMPGVVHMTYNLFGKKERSELDNSNG